MELGLGEIETLQNIQSKKKRGGIIEDPNS